MDDKLCASARGLETGVSSIQIASQQRDMSTKVSETTGRKIDGRGAMVLEKRRSQKFSVFCDRLQKIALFFVPGHRKQKIKRKSVPRKGKNPQEIREFSVFCCRVRISLTANEFFDFLVEFRQHPQKSHSHV